MHGYPEDCKPKLLLRKAECLVTLGRPQGQARPSLILKVALLPSQPSQLPSFRLQRTLCRVKVKVQEKNLPEIFPEALTKTFEVWT